jgi:carotenoid 1,2-hydratase
MTERTEHAIGLSPKEFNIGPSKMIWNGNSLDINFKEITIPHLNTLEGTISLIPENITDIEVLLKSDGTHIWRPFAPISRIKVDINQKGWNWHGNAYLDGNFGTRALEQDFSYWTWSRLPFRDHTVTFYDAELTNGGKTNIALKFGKNGSLNTINPPPLKNIKRTNWLLRREARADEDFVPYQKKPLLDSPFYSRSELVTKINGEKTVGIHEALDMKRFTNPFIQPLLCVKIPRVFKFT